MLSSREVFPVVLNIIRLRQAKIFWFTLKYFNFLLIIFLKKHPFLMNKQFHYRVGFQDDSVVICILFFDLFKND